MRQYHLTFLCSEPPENKLFYISKAKNEREAINNVVGEVQVRFFEEYGKHVTFQIESEFFDLNTYPLKDIQVKELISSYPTIIKGEILGKLIVWFNDRDIDFITSFFNKDKLALSRLEKFLYPCEINIEPNKLEELRKFIRE